MPIKTSLRDTFGIKEKEVISLVGAGGKTSLMQALANELSMNGSTVITTTTTKILESQSPSPCLIVEPDEEKLFELLLQALETHLHVTLASARLPEQGKLDGVSPRLIERMAALPKVDYIVIEADGAARRPLKAPNATEPVIPSCTSLVIAVAGIDALGKPLNKENAFRPEIISMLTGLSLNEEITPATIATLLTHPQGSAKGSPPGARIVPFINKVGSYVELRQAEEIAQKIIERKNPCIKEIVLGQLQPPPPPTFRVIQMA